MSRRLFGLAAILGALATVPLAGTRSTFIPDWTFKGSTLAGWHVLGAADWKAIDGELVGTPNRRTAAGWYSTNRFRMSSLAPTSSASARAAPVCCCAPRRRPTGMKGVFLSLDEGEVGGYAVTLDASGKILTRERLRPGGGLMRVAPSAAEAAAAAAARGGGAGRGAPGAAGARGWRPRARCSAARRCPTWCSRPHSSRTTGMTSMSSSTPTSCGPG